MRFACLLVALAAPLVSAQTLTGRVVDAVTQATLPGANVAVLGADDELAHGNDHVRNERDGRAG